MKTFLVLVLFEAVLGQKIRAFYSGHGCGIVKEISTARKIPTENRTCTDIDALVPIAVPDTGEPAIFIYKNTNNVYTFILILKLWKGCQEFGRTGEPMAHVTKRVVRAPRFEQDLA